MAIYRSVHISFWTDTKVVDNFTPEDKYFMLYCLTNQYTNLIGCYEISMKQMSLDLGYDKDTIEKLIDRFKNIHKIIDYDTKTKELFIKNWYKYNWTNSPKLEKSLLEQIDYIKSNKFKEEIIDIYNSRDTLSIPYEYPMDTSVTDTVSDTDTITDIINYLNNKINSNYRSNNKVTIKHIKARLNEGYTLQDFIKVIDNKYNDWFNTDMAKFLRPETLFGTKFENYLNQVQKKKTLKDISIKELEAINDTNRIY
jgi:uncharacterized phage protein (TIGR02220 family)